MAVQLKDLDLSRLSYSIYDEDFVDKLRENIPEFEAYDNKLDSVVVFRFIVLMWDINSPLQQMQEYSDYYVRMYACASLSGMPKKKGEFTEEANEIILGKNKLVNDMIVAYVASFGLPEYSLLMAYQALFASEYKKVLLGKGGKDSEKIMTSASNNIASYTRKIFGLGEQDEYSLRKQALYSRLEKEKLRLRPEQIVREFADKGKLPDDFNPYGEDYEVNINEDMKFMGDKLPNEN